MKVPVLLVAIGCGSRAEAPAPSASTRETVGLTGSQVAAVAAVSPDVAPPTSASGSAPDHSEPDYGQVIQRIVRQSFGRFRHCYENAPPRLTEEVTVSFTIGAEGNVISASAKSAMGDADLASCVSKAFHGLSFPKPPGGVAKVIYPINIRSFRQADGG